MSIELKPPYVNPMTYRERLKDLNGFYDRFRCDPQMIFAAFKNFHKAFPGNYTLNVEYDASSREGIIIRLLFDTPYDETIFRLIHD